MKFLDLVKNSQKHFPDLKIKYKDSSSFMKFIGTLLFFNKRFMTSYTTTIGSTVYFPNTSFVRTKPIASSIILLHELVHIYDSKKFSNLLFSFLYLTPQILALLAVPFYFLIGWWSSLFLILLLPLPSFFRMYFERRAYFTSLYVLYRLGKKLNFDPRLEENKASFIKQFKNSSYYYMWIFNLDGSFEEATQNILKGKTPFEDPVFNILDQIIEDI